MNIELNLDEFAVLNTCLNSAIERKRILLNEEREYMKSCSEPFSKNAKDAIDRIADLEAELSELRSLSKKINGESNTRTDDSCCNCDAYDEDREGCTLPSCDKSYACSKDVSESDLNELVITVNDYITRNDPDVEIIIEAMIPGTCTSERYFKGMLGDVPEKLRNVEVIKRSWSVLNEMWVLDVSRDPSLKEVQA